MLRHLAGYLREQEAVREDESFPAGFTLEVQGICPPVLSGGPAQRAAALTLEIFLQCEGRTLFPFDAALGFLLDLLLHSPEGIPVQDRRIPVRPGVAGILQQTLHLVLVPESGLGTERDAVCIEAGADLLVGCPGEVEGGDPLHRLRLLGDNRQLTPLDLIAV